MSETSSLLNPSPAGPSSSYSAQTLPLPLPESLQRDDPTAVEQARQRLSKRGLLSHVSLPLPHILRTKSKSRLSDSSTSLPVVEISRRNTPLPQDRADLVLLDEGHLTADLDENYDKDVYRWAILYENQRGAMVFSTPYYSPQTLLPLDPPPFTIPIPGSSPRKNQPTVSLEDYPLPDGSWRWVSRAWMIDMRGDGQVQYDGFEYSRSFRSKKWGPDTGFMSNRGLVRRRRWIRLMMRPARAFHDAFSIISAPGALAPMPDLELHHEEQASRPPSIMLTMAGEEGDVWRGEADDWERCRLALGRLGRDGRKLELWASWLGVESIPLSCVSPQKSIIPPFVKTMEPDNTDGESEIRTGGLSAKEAAPVSNSRTEADKLKTDVGVSIAEAPKEYVIPVIRAHGSDILSLLVYPDSRAKFLVLLGKAGLLAELRLGLGVSESAQFLDFWSYTHDLGMDADSVRSS